MIVCLRRLPGAVSVAFYPLSFSHSFFYSLVLKRKDLRALRFGAFDIQLLNDYFYLPTAGSFTFSFSYSGLFAVSANISRRSHADIHPGPDYAMPVKASLAG